MHDLNDDELQQQLNLETGKISWPELQRHFARGVVIKVNQGLDLVEVAAHFVRDDKATIENWLNEGSVCRASDEDARQWIENQSDFWAVVVAPWVLVQELKE